MQRKAASVKTKEVKRFIFFFIIHHIINTNILQYLKKKEFRKQQLYKLDLPSESLNCLKLQWKS